jgi:hypothetical protein
MITVFGTRLHRKLLGRPWEEKEKGLGLETSEAEVLVKIERADQTSDM